MTKKKKLIIISIVALVIILIGGGSYAWFNYYKVSDVTNLLVAGDIRLNLLEGEDTLVLTNVFPETKEEARSHTGNILTFSVSGTNESSKAILYNILLNQGTGKNGKTRFRDDELRFDLIEIVNNNEVYLVDGASFNTLSDTSIYDNIVPANTNSVSHTYKIRVWVDEGVTISETVSGTHIYTPSEYKDLYATVKLAIKGESIEGTRYTVTFDANGGTVGVSTKDVIAGQAYGFLPTPTREGYTFLGWNGKNILNLNVDESLPSQTNTSNSTDRTFILNSYVKGLSFNNYYNPTMIISSSISSELLNINSTGSGYGFGFPFHIEPSADYNLSFNVNSNGLYSMLYYQENGSLIEYNYWRCTNTSISKSFTIPANTYYLVVLLAPYAGYNVTFSNIQLEEGATATAYEPYYLTSNTNVVQEANHTLKAIWQENT